MVIWGFREYTSFIMFGIYLYTHGRILGVREL